MDPALVITVVIVVGTTVFVRKHVNGGIDAVAESAGVEERKLSWFGPVLRGSWRGCAVMLRGERARVIVEIGAAAPAQVSITPRGDALSYDGEPALAERLLNDVALRQPFEAALRDRGDVLELDASLVRVIRSFASMDDREAALMKALALATQVVERLSLPPVG